MSLDEYKQKRDFDDTNEPQAQRSSGDDELHFSVQRHDASNLHYDLRLEMEGVLKSWAIPKGPSMNPDDKRLAIHTEDHPFDYLTFEGTIEEGNYGAGTVELWDLGSYQPANTDEDSGEESLLNALGDGSLKIQFDGQKLNGGFALVDMKNQDEDQWLLIKKDDEQAVDESYDSENHLEDVKKRSCKCEQEKQR